jgi:uncharacterized protein YbjT (DUF2867 family)
MEKAGKIILVAGATGTQGGCAARALLKNGWHVRALVRDPAKPAAQALQQLGAELVAGNLDDQHSLGRALAGVYGVFSVQGFLEQGLDGELRQGKALADAARAADVKHFVYSSVHSANLNSGIPHFDSKGKIEEHIQSLGLPHTILRPVFFMENFNNYFPPALEDGVWTLRLALHPQTKLSMIAAEDIGAFTAIAFNHPDRYLDKAFEIAGEALTLPQVAEKMHKHTAKPFRFIELPIEQVRAFSADFALMFEYFNNVGQPVDVAGLYTIHSGLLNFDEWLAKSNWQPRAAS